MKNNLILVAKLIVAIILLQTLYFKFTASKESVYIFTTLGIEPFGRIGSGITELIASICLFINKTRLYAAVTAMATMFVAIISHLFIIGIEVMNDGGVLFTFAIITFLLSAIIAIYHISDLKKLNNSFINAIIK